MDIVNLQSPSDSSPNLNIVPKIFDISLSEQTAQEEFFYPLSNTQRQQLDTVISLFLNFEKQGLGRTSLINHKIDVGDATSIKQRHYPVSPAIEKIMFKEIDRMFALGVIEPSTSSWSSPMRLVVKPNKIRFYLDARKLRILYLQ